MENINEYEDFSSRNSWKVMGKNLVPGLLIMLGAAGKLFEAKVLSVNTTPDGRMYLELMGNGTPGSGIQASRLTEPIRPNDIISVKNPYGKDMRNKAAAATYYSEEQIDLFNEIDDSMKEYKDSGMTTVQSFSEVASDLLNIGMTQDEVKSTLSEYNNYSVKMTKKELERNDRALNNEYKWGVPDPDMRFSNIGLKQMVKAGFGLKQFIYGKHWAEDERSKKAVNDFTKVCRRLADEVATTSMREEDAKAELARKVNELSPEAKKVYLELIRS